MEEADIVKWLVNKIPSMFDVLEHNIKTNLWVRGAEGVFEVDVVALTKSGKTLAFEVKAPGISLGETFDQIINYIRYADKTYSVIDSKVITSDELTFWSKMGVGLVSYTVSHGEVFFDVKCESESFRRSGSQILRKLVMEERLYRMHDISFYKPPSELDEVFSDLSVSSNDNKLHYLTQPGSTVFIFTKEGGDLLVVGEISILQKIEKPEGSRFVVMGNPMKSWRYPEPLKVSEIEVNLHLKTGKKSLWPSIRYINIVDNHDRNLILSKAIERNISVIRKYGG